MGEVGEVGGVPPVKEVFGIQDRPRGNRNARPKRKSSKSPVNSEERPPLPEEGEVYGPDGRLKVTGGQNTIDVKA